MTTIQCSVGEILDKFSILEIKSERIQQSDKQQAVQKEIDCLIDYVKQYTHMPEYRVLKYINETIWDLNDLYCRQQSFNGKEIMNANNSRFRIKKRINNIVNSYLEEVKSYTEDTIIIDATNEDDMINIHIYTLWISMFHDNITLVLKGDIHNKNNNNFVLTLDMTEIPLKFLAICKIV